MSLFEDEPQEKRPLHKSQTFRVLLIVVPFAVVGIALATLVHNNTPPQQQTVTGDRTPGAAVAQTPEERVITAAAKKTLALSQLSLRAYDKQVVSGQVTRLTLTHQVVSLPWVDGTVRWVGTAQRAVSDPAHLMQIIVHIGQQGTTSYIHFKELQLKAGKSWLETKRQVTFPESNDASDPNRIGSAAVSSGAYLPNQVIPEVLSSLTYLNKVRIASYLPFNRYQGIDPTKQVAYTVEVTKDGYLRRFISSRKAQGDQGPTTYVKAVTYYDFGKAAEISAPAAAMVQASR